MGSGDIDRELDEIRESYLGERNSLRACLRQAFEIGRADGRNAEREGDPSPCPDPTMGREYRGGTTIEKVTGLALFTAIYVWSKLS
jgi:hypothetical protein